MFPEPFDVLVLVMTPVLGALIGSFLNVCIYRLPRESRSVVHPPSHCPTCGTNLAPWMNVPIVSFLVLLGKCHYCRSRIGWKYPAIEALTAALFGAAAWAFVHGWWRFEGIAGQPYEAVSVVERLGVLGVGLFLIACTVVATFVDLRYRIIPDEVTVMVVVPSIVLSMLFPAVHEGLPTDVFHDRHLAGLFAALQGAFVGGFSIFAIGYLGKILFRQEAMGFGDVKMMAFLGAIVGWKGALLTIVLACILGSVFGIFSLIITRDRYTPFGPYLAIAAIAAFCARDPIIRLLVEGFPSMVMGPL